MLLGIGAAFGLEQDDVKSVSMGVSGLDVLLSPAARKVLGPLAIECKNCQTLNHTSVFWKHNEKYPELDAVLVSKRNHTTPLVTMKLSMFTNLLRRSLGMQHAK